MGPVHPTRTICKMGLRNLPSALGETPQAGYRAPPPRVTALSDLSDLLVCRQEKDTSKSLADDPVGEIQESVRNPGVCLQATENNSACILEDHKPETYLIRGVLIVVVRVEVARARPRAPGSRVRLLVGHEDGMHVGRRPEERLGGRERPRPSPAARFAQWPRERADRVRLSSPRRAKPEDDLPDFGRASRARSDLSILWRNPMARPSRLAEPDRRTVRAGEADQLDDDGFVRARPANPPDATRPGSTGTGRRGRRPPRCAWSKALDPHFEPRSPAPQLVQLRIDPGAVGLAIAAQSSPASATRITRQDTAPRIEMARGTLAEPEGQSALRDERSGGPYAGPRGGDRGRDDGSNRTHRPQPRRGTPPRRGRRVSEDRPCRRACSGPRLASPVGSGTACRRISFGAELAGLAGTEAGLDERRPVKAARMRRQTVATSRCPTARSSSPGGGVVGQLGQELPRRRETRSISVRRDRRRQGRRRAASGRRRAGRRRVGRGPGAAGPRSERHSR